jgi:hypothetical protein
MPRLLAALLLSALLLPAGANAEIARAPLGALTIEYDAEVWVPAEPPAGLALVMSCIAADCTNERGDFANVQAD